jgi:hypothetical protein
LIFWGILEYDGLRLLIRPYTIFFLERAGELRINILRRKRGKEPQNVTELRACIPPFYRIKLLTSFMGVSLPMMGQENAFNHHSLCHAKKHIVFVL